MNRPKLTIAATMGVVVLIALGLASLRHPSYLAANAIFSLALTIHATVLVALVSRKGTRRPAWVASALCGWGYLALSLGPGAESSTAPHLITTTLIDLGYEGCYSTSYSWPELRETPAFPADKNKAQLWDWPDHVVDKRLHNAAFQIMTPEPFFRIGHSLFSLATALVGGLLGRSFARRGDDCKPSDNGQSPSALRAPGTP